MLHGQSACSYRDLPLSLLYSPVQFASVNSEILPFLLGRPLVQAAMASQKQAAGVR